jgi:hypothetical protein
MRRNVLGLAILAGLAMVVGCQTGAKKVRRPELAQEYRLPPEEDRRYSQPPALPTKVLLDDPLARRRENDAKNLQAPMMAGPGRPGGPVGPTP